MFWFKKKESHSKPITSKELYEIELYRLRKEAIDSGEYEEEISCKEYSGESDTGRSWAMGCYISIIVKFKRDILGEINIDKGIIHGCCTSPYGVSEGTRITSVWDDTEGIEKYILDTYLKKYNINKKKQKELRIRTEEEKYTRKLNELLGIN